MGERVYRFRTCKLYSGKEHTGQRWYVYRWLTVEGPDGEEIGGRWVLAASGDAPDKWWAQREARLCIERWPVVDGKGE